MCQHCDDEEPQYTEREQQIVDAFWVAIEAANASWIDLNKGLKIKFTFGGKEYTVDTKHGSFNISMPAYQEMIERRAIATVGGN